jgi:predicted ATPase
MPGNTASTNPALSFTTFGAFLHYLRRRARLTQRELGIAVGYSTPQISLLENGHRLPDLATVAALFVPALDVQQEPELMNRLLQLAIVAQERAGSRVGPAAVSIYRQPIRRAPSHLPAPTLPLIGRTHELERIRDRLHDPGVRLLTLLGPPGVGKTRLALQVAWEAEALFADGARFIALGALADPTLVAATIMQALGTADMNGDPDLGIARLGDDLHDKQMLLVLDNFEHLLAAAPLVGQLLAAAPHINILVTSRTALHIYGEYEIPLAPLALPDLALLPPLEQLADLPAVALFIARAQAARPDFALTTANAQAVAAICVRLDGLPLAIELAAAQSKLFPPHALAAQLVRGVVGDHGPALRLSVLRRDTVDLPARHRTLHNAIAWSYQLLSPAQQLLVERLAVFVGGCTLAAAEAVCSDGRAQNGELRPALLESLAALVDASLIQRDERAGEPCFTMLETIRAFALERLDARGCVAQVQRSHAIFFLALAQAADEQLATPEQTAWLQRLEYEQGNLRAALGWALESSGLDDRSAEAAPPRAEVALRLCVALWKFWRYRSYVAEGYRWIARALGAAPARMRQVQPDLVARTAWGAGMLASVMRQDAAATAYLEESLALWRLAEDGEGIAGALTALGARAMQRGDSGQALTLQQEALALYESQGQLHGMTYAHNALGESLRSIGNYDASRAHYQASLAVSRQIGHGRGVAVALANLAHLALETSDSAAAQQGFVESVALFREIDDRINIATCLMGLACVTIIGGTPSHMREAALVWGFAQQLLHESGGQIEVTDQRTFAPYIAVCRRMLGEAVFQAACQEGQALSLQQTVAQMILQAPPQQQP